MEWTRDVHGRENLYVVGDGVVREYAAPGNKLNVLREIAPSWETSETTPTVAVTNNVVKGVVAVCSGDKATSISLFSTRVWARQMRVIEEEELDHAVRTESHYHGLWIRSLARYMFSYCPVFVGKSTACCQLRLRARRQLCGLKCHISLPYMPMFILYLFES